jgi:PAS domain S-box-containing protein
MELYSYTLQVQGEDKFYESRLVPYGNHQYLAIVRDITQKQLDEINLRESKQKLKDAMKTAKLGSWELDLITNKLFWSEETYEIFGLDPKITEPSYDQFMQYVYPDDQNWVDRAYKDSLIDKLPYEIKHRIMTQRGELKYVKEKCRTVFDHEGKPLKSFGVIQDITDLKKIELDLIKSKEKAEESDKLKSAFLANMSHEIRTPMNAIMGFSSLLKEKEFKKEKQNYFLNIINSRTKDLLRIIDDVIDISKIEANQLRIEKTDFSLNKALLEIYSGIKSDLQNQNRDDLKIRINEQLLVKPLIIHSDESRLKQVLLNLIYNAVKFTENGFIEFGYSIERDDNILQFYVKDTGIGIPEKAGEFIFERFRQADDSTSRKYGGTGLGLPICKSVVELLGGKIWFESEEEKGTTFYFTVPLIESKPKHVENNGAATISQFDWSNKTVLIAEDDLASMHYLAELINPTHMKIIKAESGEKVMEVLNTGSSIDIILLDINLPDSNGNELVKTIKKKNPKMPVIAQSAYSMLEEIKNSLSLGFDDYITKPIDAKLLLSTMNKYLDRK